MKKQKKVSQTDRLSEKLKAIKPDVTAEDRNELQKMKGHSKGTISRYLNGDVFDNDTAVSILNFLRDRIAAREKAIA